jgi:ethanolamine utilization protein EutM
MVKAANATLQTAQQPGGGIITAIVVGAVRAAGAAGAAGAAAKGTVGKVGAAHVIPRPHEEVEDIIERPCVR